MALLHTKWAHLPKLVRSSVLLRDTIVTWKELRKILGLPFCVSKLMPLWGHPEFGVGVGSNSGQALKQKGILTAQHLIHPDEGRWLRATEVIERYSLPATQFLAVAQIIHFCRARLLDLSREASINSFDEILNKSSQDHGISCLYALIRQHMAKCTHPQTGFQKILSGWGAIRKHIVNETWRETFYKIVHNAIYGFNLPATPLNSARLTACPKCGTPSTDMWHGLWQCPAIQRYWAQVQEFVNDMCNAHMGINADSLIFHCVCHPEPQSGPPASATAQALPHAALIHISLLAAKRCITKLWLSPATPTITLLKSQIGSYLHMDRLYVERNPETGAKGFFKKWKCFIVRHLSQEEIETLMLPFRNTSWFLTAQLAGTLGALDNS